MTLQTVFQRDTNYQTSCSMRGEWYVATNTLRHNSLEELGIPNATGAIVLACRNGLWDSTLKTQDIEIFLWGTEEQLSAAQQQFKLQPLIDRQLDCPELYWG